MPPKKTRTKTTRKPRRDPSREPRFTTASLAAMAELKAAMMTPEEIEDFTRFAARIDQKYSLRNRFLMWIQRPNATRIAARSTWFEDHDRKISGGQGCGIAIVAPLTRKKDDGQTGEGPKKPKVEQGDRREVWGIKVTYVFDIADTSPLEDEPEAQTATPAAQPGPAPEASEVADMLTTILEEKHSEEIAAPQ